MRSSSFPCIKIDERGSKCKVLYGSLRCEITGGIAQGPGNELTDSKLCILTISLAPGAKYCLSFPAGSSCLVYVQSGALVSEGGRIDHCNLCTYTSAPLTTDDTASITLTSVDDQITELLVLLGETLKERAIMSGPFVASSSQEYNRIATAWQGVGQTAFWDHTLPDEQWKNHVSTLDLQEQLETALKLY